MQMHDGGKGEQSFNQMHYRLNKFIDLINDS